MFDIILYVEVDSYSPEYNHQYYFTMFIICYVLNQPTVINIKRTLVGFHVIYIWLKYYCCKKKEELIVH